MNIDWSQVGLITAYVLLVVTTTGGLVGSFVPALPGAVIIWGGALLHGALTGFDPLGLYAQITLAALTGLSAGGQLAISALGAKKFGSSAWGVLGAGIGVLLGTILIPLPVAGSLFGAFLGALAFELFVAQPRGRARAEATPTGRDGGKEVGQAAKAGLGAAIGTVLGMMAEIGVAFVMAVVIVTAVVF